MDLLKSDIFGEYASQDEPLDEFVERVISTEALKGCVDQNSKLKKTTKLGSFLANSKIYNQPQEVLSKEIKLLLQKHHNHACSKNLNVGRVRYLVSTTLDRIAGGLDKIDVSCWECGQEFEAMGFACSGCGIAKYCGMCILLFHLDPSLPPM